jgi:hypothetical protein
MEIPRWIANSCGVWPLALCSFDPVFAYGPILTHVLIRLTWESLTTQSIDSISVAFGLGEDLKALLSWFLLNKDIIPAPVFSIHYVVTPRPGFTLSTV